MQVNTILDHTDCPILQADGWPGQEAAFEAALSQLWDAPLPQGVGDIMETAHGRVLRVTPRRFWLIGREAAPTISLGDFGALTPLAEGRVAFRLNGPGARRRLEEFVAVDWDHPSCRPGRAVLAAIQRIPVCVIRHEADAFEVIVPRSFAQSVGGLL